MQRLCLTGAALLTVAMGLTACNNPYDPGQRAVGGAVLGAGTGAAIGAVAGGGRGAAIGALAGGAIGAVGGAATTPPGPYYHATQPGYYPPYQPAYHAPAYHAPGYQPPGLTGYDPYQQSVPQGGWASDSYAPAQYGQRAPYGENCGTPDEPKQCPPMPRVPLQYYPANRQ